MKYRLLDEGILAVMTFFQNMILETAFGGQADSNFSSVVFSRETFYDLDRYMVYMFKMFQ